MDIQREQKPKWRKYIWVGPAVLGLVVVTVALANLKPAAPQVERATVWTDTVSRGLMVREVRGPGTLVPEDIRWIAARTSGRIEEIELLPGAEVEPQTVLLRLSNPDVRVQALEAEQRLTTAETELVNLRTTLAQQILTQEALVARVRAEHLEAARTASNNEPLAEMGLIAEPELITSQERAEALATQLNAEEEKLRMIREGRESRIAAQVEQVERLRAIAEFQRGRVESMNVVAGVEGVLVSLGETPLNEGQWVTPGMNLARIVQPGRLKAEVRIPETQALDVAVGQPAYIDTRNDTIPGRVLRVDPAAQNGTVLVEVTLEGELPRGARPNLSIQGTVVVDRLEDVLYVGRPSYGQANSTVGLWRVVEEGNAAVRVSVRLGASSVNTIEVVEGLRVGDTVILSDMSQWDEFNRVRLN